MQQIITIADGALKPKNIYLFGLDGDSQPAQRLLRILPPQVQAKTANLCGKTGFGDLASQLHGLDLLITPDTGTMHLAARLGVPVMAFFLSSAFCHETGPYGKGHLIWQALPPCGPCLESAPCPHNLKCHAPYSDAKFPRALTFALKKKEIPQDMMPEGLQLWETSQDVLGQKLLLQAGEDDAAEDRAIIRAILQSWLDLPNDLGAFAPEKSARLIEELIPFQEWALPPWRYD